jgi:Fe2+ transport system protein B
MNELLIGAISTSCFIIALFFLRFWHSTKDRFFLFFALAFFIECGNRLSLYLFFDLHEASPMYYLIRLVAYSFILAAIFEKNKRLYR